MSTLTSLGLMIALLSPSEPVRAMPPLPTIPHLYTDVVLGVNDLEACVANASRVAIKNGFTDTPQVINNGKKSRDFYANHASKALTLAISCTTELRAASIAVAGMDNDETFEAFKQVYADF